MVVHEADSDGQQPFVLVTPVERVLGIIRTVPGMDNDVLIGRHLSANILVYHCLESGVSLVHCCPWGEDKSQNWGNLLAKETSGLGNLISNGPFLSRLGFNRLLSLIDRVATDLILTSHDGNRSKDCCKCQTCHSGTKAENGKKEKQKINIHSKWPDRKRSGRLFSIFANAFFFSRMLEHTSIPISPLGMPRANKRLSLPIREPGRESRTVLVTHRHSTHPCWWSLIQGDFIIACTVLGVLADRFLPLFSDRELHSVLPALISLPRFHRARDAFGPLYSERFVCGAD